MNEYKDQSEFKPGEAMKLWNGIKVIHHFEEYNGTLEFVARVAVFTDGSKMSLECDHQYQVAVIG